MFSATGIPYRQTGFYSDIVTDYLEKHERLQPFFNYPADGGGLAASIVARQKNDVDRKLLVEVLNDQYKEAVHHPAVQQNIALLEENTSFTICTAHQPNLATGPLYFIYKILHVIKIAEHCNKEISSFRFVPVFYMGSEDADLEELNHFFVKGKTYTWEADQHGAVGRMKTDASLQRLFEELEHQLAVEPFGKEICGLLKKAYHTGKTIAQSTFDLVHELFGRFGLVVINADDGRLKSKLKQVFEDDLFRQVPSAIVGQTVDRLRANYKVQANPRDINLFYIEGNRRERIEAIENGFRLAQTGEKIATEKMTELLNRQPEKLSPNVILRGLYQEMILPNICFIGGGGELAYWLELKALFDHYHVHFPMLVLRNSFLVAETKWHQLVQHCGLAVEDLFKSEDEIMLKIVRLFSSNEVSLNGNIEQAKELFHQLKEKAEAVDASLKTHVAAIEKRYLNTLTALEKKMLRAEKKKFADRQRQVKKAKDVLFPASSLQERKENLATFYSKFGTAFIDEIYRHSLVLEQQFVILKETGQSN